MVPGSIPDGNVGLATTKAPFSWGPSVEHTYSFMNWARDISRWSPITDLPVHDQAVVVAL
eukprot:1269357-Lingulodinium_polyedra.AAC.1